MENHNNEVGAVVVFRATTRSCLQLLAPPTGYDGNPWSLHRFTPKHTQNPGRGGACSSREKNPICTYNPVVSATWGCRCRLFVDGSTKALPYRVRRNPVVRATIFVKRSPRGNIHDYLTYPVGTGVRSQATGLSGKTAPFAQTIPIASRRFAHITLP